MSALPPQDERRPQDLSEEEADLLRRSHHRLRKASQDLEGFTAPRHMRGRWEPAPVPAEAMDAARNEMDASYRSLCLVYQELLDWPLGSSPPPPASSGS